MDTKQVAFIEVRKAVKYGKLAKLDGSILCVDCGSPAKDYDHRDYAKPLDVVPVCRSCNKLRGRALNHPIQQRALAIRTCPHCAVEFTPLQTLGSIPKYCSKYCAHEGYKKQNLAFYHAKKAANPTWRRK